MTEPAPLSVVVPTRDRPELLELCLRSLRASLRPQDELIVADSASRNGAVKRAAESVGARYIRCELPGASRARNAGWGCAHHDIVAFIDDDVRVDPDWAEAVAGAFARAPEIAFITGRIGLSADQAETERPVAFIDERDPFPIDTTARGTLGHSANLAVRRSALEVVGGFDEILGAGGPLCGAEDYDLFDRLFAAGLIGRYEPSASSVHEQWRRKRSLLLLEWRYGIGLGARVAKLARADRRRALDASQDLYWETGLKRMAVFLVRGYEFGALLALLKTAGAIVGFGLGLGRRVRDGHFIARGRIRRARTSR